MSVLFPEGISNIGDLPYHLHDAILKGMVFTSFDELPSEEKPPRRIWLDEERLGEWFDAVDKKRREKYGDDKDKSIEDPVENDAKGALIQGL